jgi:formylglycine-generating enzyme required for sulfatase activity
MKNQIYTLVVCLLMHLACSAETPVSSSISYDSTNSSNQVELTWVAIPSKPYRILTTTAFGQPWQTLPNTPLVASNNLIRLRTSADATARFYRVSKLDVEPPEVWRIVPATSAIAVPLQSEIKIYLNEETGIDPNSISLIVGTNPPASLADPRLTLTGDVLTYTPTDNQVLGTKDETITNKLEIADTLGNRVTNTWSFNLEIVSILASNVVVIGPGSPLALVSTNGDNYVFSYTNAPSGLTNGAILVSTDPNFAYKRRVLSLTEDPVANTVSVVTTQAAVSEILSQGSIRFYAAEFLPDPPAGPRPLDAGDITIDLAGQTLFDNDKVKIETTAGRLVFAPDFAIAAEFRNPQKFDLDVSADMTFDLTIRGTWTDTWSFASDPKQIGKTLRRFRLLGCIPVVIPPGISTCIPVWAEAECKFYIGTEGQVTGTASASAGFESSCTLSFGTKFRNGQWTPFARDNSKFTPYPVSWQGGGAGRVRAFVEPKLTIYLESVAGPSASLRPYLEVVANACVQPGQTGVDLSLNAGLTGTLAVDVRYWNKGWASLPSQEIFDARAVTPLWHKILTTPSGPPPLFAGNLVWIPCGTFTMGSPASEAFRDPWEGPQTRVTISQGFWMGKYEVTEGEYLAVMRNTGGDFSRPVERVSWDAAVAYCAALTARERKAGRLPAGYVYRLPTEAEWEYACRAGTTTRFHYGNELRSGMANFFGYYEYRTGEPEHRNPSGIYLGHATSVGSYAPNAWGLHDMHGNVWEWCQDWWSSSLPGGHVTDPQGPPSGPTRVIRGGNWYVFAFYCRSTHRMPFNPDYETNFNIGFRTVLAPGR